jgi:hypothetical protein
MAMRSLACVVALAAAAGSLAAVEEDFGGFSDLRFSLHAAGVGYDVEYLNHTERDSFDVAMRGNLAWIASLGIIPGHGGLIVGLAGNGIYDKGQLSNGFDVVLQGWTIEALCGWGWPVSEHAQFEILPHVGFGRATMTLNNPSPGINDEQGTNTLWEVGFFANLIWTWPSGLQLGGTFGYDISKTSIDDDNSNLTFNWNLSNPTIAFVIGCRL